MTSRLIEPSFWTQPLNDRMREMIAIRESGPFSKVDFVNEMTGAEEEFFAVTRFDEIVQISKNAKDFSSAEGAISIVDLPPEALEFFGSFINMDNHGTSVSGRSSPKHSHLPTSLPCLIRLRPSRARSLTGFAKKARSILCRRSRSRFRCLSFAT